MVWKTPGLNDWILFDLGICGGARGCSFPQSKKNSGFDGKLNIHGESRRAPVRSLTVPSVYLILLSQLKPVYSGVGWEGGLRVNSLLLIKEFSPSSRVCVRVRVRPQSSVQPTPIFIIQQIVEANHVPYYILTEHIPFPHGVISSTTPPPHATLLVS